MSLSAGLGEDDYADSYFGLQQADFRIIGAAVDFHGIISHARNLSSIFFM